MADPLSLAASILAVAGAAQAAAKGIGKIIALKNAPEQLSQIYDEVCVLESPSFKEPGTDKGTLKVSEVRSSGNYYQECSQGIKFPRRQCHTTLPYFAG